MSGFLAGIQAALLSLLVVAVPALAAYVATSADPSNADVGWTASVAVGAAIWLMGHGATLTAGGAAISMVPLGVTALALFAACASARRSAYPVRPAWVAGIAGYGLVVVAGVVLAGDAGPLGAGAGSLLRTGIGAVAVAALGLGAGMVRPRRLRAATRQWWSRPPPVVRLGMTAGVLATCLVVGMAALVMVEWVVAGRAATGDVIAGLGVDTFGGVLLAVAQLAFAPNLVLWVVAWLVGPGFTVGAGTTFSPAVVVSGPLPAVPMLGALPGPGGGGGVLRFVPLGVVAIGAVAGWWLHRRVQSTRARDAAVACAVAAATAGVLVGLLTAVSGGSLGPGRLAVVGGHVAAVGAAMVLWVLLGTALVAVPGDPLFRAAARTGAGVAWRRLRGTPTVGAASAAPRDEGPAGSDDVPDVDLADDWAAEPAVDRTAGPASTPAEPAGTDVHPGSGARPATAGDADRADADADGEVGHAPAAETRP